MTRSSFALFLAGVAAVSMAPAAAGAVSPPGAVGGGPVMPSPTPAASSPAPATSSSPGTQPAMSLPIPVTIIGGQALAGPSGPAGSALPVGPAGQPNPTPLPSGSASPGVPLPGSSPVASVQRPGAGAARPGRPATAGAAPGSIGSIVNPIVGSGPVTALPAPIQQFVDQPLGPVPPVLGFILLALALMLAIRRRWAAARRDRELEEAKTAFMRVASHELRTPLTVIRGYVSMAAEGALSGSQADMEEVVTSLNSNVDDLYRLTELMLEAAQIDSRSLRLHKQAVDLRDVVRDAVHSIEERLGSRYRLVVETDTRPVPVRADPDRLRTVVVNLVDNAVKSSSPGSEIRCRVYLAGRQARFDVRDQAPGIPAEDVPNLFTRFGKGGEMTGSGLGLYLARELTRMHGGEIKVQPADGAGNTFAVSLPLSQSLWTRLRRQPAEEAGKAAAG